MCGSAESIRGRNRDNPVFLWVRGGLGYSTILQTAFFTVWEGGLHGLDVGPARRWQDLHEE